MKAPAFQLYAADFYTDTVSWTATEVGVYFRLLMHEWINGPLPSSMAKLARIAGVDARNMQKMWSAELANKFIMDDAGMYVNLRLEQTRDEQRKRSEIQKDKGKSGAEKRWHKDITSAIARAQPDDSSSSSSSTSKKKDIVDTPKKKASTNPEIKLFTDYAAQTFENAIHEKMMVDGGKDGTLVKKLLGTYDLEKLKRLWDDFMKSDDPFILKQGRSIGMFKTQINKLISARENKFPAQPPPENPVDRRMRIMKENGEI